MNQAAGLQSVTAWVDMAVLRQFLPDDLAVIASFLQQVAIEGARNLSAAQRLLREGDRQGLASQLHRLAGSCQLLKIVKITDELLQLEALVDAGEEVAILQMRLDDVQNNFDDFTQTVQLMTSLSSRQP